MNSSVTPLVSVIIPAFNAERYLDDAIVSVLEQSFQNLEILVIDDGSSDRTVEVAESFAPRIKICRRVHCGIGATRNAGVSEATGEFLCFLDADDVWLPKKTELQLSEMRDRPEVDIVFGKMENFLSPELEPDRLSSLSFPEGVQKGWHPGTLLARKGVFEEIGEFRSDLAVGEFVDWFGRAKEMGVKFSLVENLVLRRRIHEHNTTRTAERSSEDYLSVVAAKLARSRKKKN